MKLSSLMGYTLTLAILAPAIVAQTVELNNTGDTRTPELRFPLDPQFATLPARGVDFSRVDSDSVNASTIPFWSGKRTYQGVTYNFRMVGHAVNVHQVNQSVTIPTVLIPVKIVFQPQNVTFDPTASNPCSPAGTPFNLTKQSPEFHNFKYVVGGTDVGTTQYTDFFQRANFWKDTKPGGVNPNYHVLLGESNPVKITVTANNFPNPVNAPCGQIGLLEFNGWDAFLQGTLIPLVKNYVNPANFPIFLLSDVVFYDTNVNNCCILGYHSAFGSPVQTYSVAEYDTSGAFRGTEDISALSHEVGEWMDDPLINNATPAWGHIGQVSGCQGNLEVGDPLSGTIIAVTMPNGFTYHPQELAFFSWFYREAPSEGVHGWYSSNGTFRTFPPICH